MGRDGVAPLKATQVTLTGSVALWVVAAVLLSSCSMLRSSTERRFEEAARLATWGPGGTAWVSVPSGTFQMGSDTNEENEAPVHTVSLAAFELSATEVTVSQYRACVAAGACASADSCEWGTPNFSTPDREDHPINCVTWDDASTFAGWAGGRLPTEAEWEYAARGGESFTYSGSETVTDVGWIRANSERRTRSVGGKDANGYGLFDMTGNVLEWVSDWYSSDYYSHSPSSNPENTTASAYRVLRSGSHDNDESFGRVAYRTGDTPDSRYITIGFRIAR